MGKHKAIAQELKGKDGKILPPDVPKGCTPDTLYFECTRSGTATGPNLKRFQYFDFKKGKLYEIAVHAPRHKDPAIDKASMVASWYKLKNQLLSIGNALTEEEYKKKGGTYRGADAEGKVSPLKLLEETDLGKKIIKKKE